MASGNSLFFFLLMSILALPAHVSALEALSSDTQNDTASLFDEPIPIDAQRAFKEAISSLKDGNVDRAELLFTALSRTQPKLAGPYTNLGIIYSKTDRLNKAEGALLRSVTLNSENPHVYNYLGIVYRKIGRFHDALTYYKKALELSSDLADVHLNIGILYDLYLSNPVKALEHYQHFQALNGKEDKDVHKWIVEVTRRIKRSKR